MANSFKSVVKCEFNSVEDYITYIQDHKSMSGRRSSMRRGDDWSGSDSIEHSIEIARKGAELERVAVEVNNVANNHDFQQMEIVREVSGAVVDMGAYLSGEPENMIDFPVVTDTKFLDILVDVGELADMSGEALTNKAIAAACLVDYLENHGYRVSVKAAGVQKFTQSVNGDEDRDFAHWVLTTVNIKSHHEQLSLGQLTGCLHAGFFRRLMFAQWERMYNNRVPFGYGKQADTRTELEWCLKELNEEKAVFLPNSQLARALGGPSNVHSLDGAKKWAEYFATQTIQKNGELAV